MIIENFSCIFVIPHSSMYIRIDMQPSYLILFNLIRSKNVKGKGMRKVLKFEDFYYNR